MGRRERRGLITSYPSLTEWRADNYLSDAVWSIVRRLLGKGAERLELITLYPSLRFASITSTVRNMITIYPARVEG